ncbi:MAG TPA: efflux RND transporter permease subunit [Devosiaceae bacterium]|nr:efflux RND transporter permease subunit [Devosiaceae bacterium]
MSIEKQNEQGGAIASLFVRRPVLAMVLNALIIVAGIAAFLGVEVRELPNVDQPVLSVNTDYDGATAQTVDNEITSTIEGAIARVQGVSSISSSSSLGRSRISIGFVDGTNLDAATSDVRDALARVANKLPDSIDPPSVVKADANAQPIIQLAVTSDTLKRDDLTKLVDNTISERLAAVPGVADVLVYGEAAKAYLVDINPAKLANAGLTVADMIAALDSVAFDAPSGTINGANQSLAVRAVAQVQSPAEFENIVVKGKIRVGDVANVVFDAQNPASGLRSDGRSGIGIGVVRSADSNTINISRDVKAAVQDLKKTLPASVDLRISSDDSIFISGAVDEVERSLLISVVAVIAIIFLFLLDWRATLVPAISMPVALIGTIAGIYLAGFSINILTLLALVLATGLVVDDSIVVLENITRRRAMGLGPRAAAVLGTQEVFFAVIATTATLIAVFVPLSFLPGQTGRLFREFGFTLAISVALSAVVALSMGPMLASRLLKGAAEMGHDRPRTDPLHRFGSALSGLYQRLLHLALDNSLVVIVISLLVAGAAVATFTTLRQELTPPEDRAAIRLSVTAPSTVSLDFTQSQMQRVDDLLQPLRDAGEVTSTFSIAGINGSTSRGFMTVTLAPWDKRHRSQAEIIAQVNQLLQQVPGIRVTTISGNSLGIRGGGNGLQFAVIGDDYESLSASAEKIADQMKEDPRFGRVVVNYDPTQPQLTLNIDRDKAAALGIDINGLGPTLQSMIDGDEIANVFADDTTYPVMLISTTSPVNDPRDLENIFVKTADGRFVPMSSIASLTEQPIAPSLDREQQRRAVSITASLGDQLALGDAYNMVLDMARPVLAPNQAIIPLAEAKTLGVNNNGLVITFGFALVVVLLVLAAQFESILSAVIVMATVPFGLACAIFALKFSGGSLNVYSQIGLILVVGIMAKNGILIVEFANQLRERGRSVREAIEEASNIRLRPVIMTMIATVLGGLPLLMGHGAGAEARQALGAVMVGGLTLAAVATLFLTPIAYLLLARFSKPRSEESVRLARELREAPDQDAEPARHEVIPLPPRPVAAE